MEDKMNGQQVVVTSEESDETGIQALIMRIDNGVFRPSREHYHPKRVGKKADDTSQE